MPPTKPIPVRLSDDVIRRLDKVAGEMGSNRAALIKFCTRTFLEHLERKGMSALPPDWEDILRRADGRRNA